MPNYYVLNESGEPVSSGPVESFKWWIDHQEQVYIRRDRVAEVHIVTRFLGNDLEFLKRKEIHFKTFIFDGEDCHHLIHSTRENAIKSHDAVVRNLRKQKEAA